MKQETLNPVEETRDIKMNGYINTLSSMKLKK